MGRAVKVFRGIRELLSPFARYREAALAVREGRVAWVGPERELPEAFASWPQEDLLGASVVPGLVDPHTHLIYAGDRYEEFLRRSRGEPYEAILRAGGGIYETVRATVQAEDEVLLSSAQARARSLLAHGVTSLEIKSGYGLEPEAELRLLRLIRRLEERVPQRVFATLLAHAVPRGWARKTYLRTLVEEVLPQVARERLALMADVFCDQGAFTVEEAEVFLSRAKAHGLGVRLHAEQIARTGASQLAARLQALSADHLEMATPEDLSSLAEAGVVAVLLPGAALSLKKPLPQAAFLRQAGVRVALASDHNPGTSPLLNPWLTMALAVHVVGLGAEEALIAHTAHAALALGRPELGRLEPGAVADFVALEVPPLDPIYRFGEHPPLAVYVGGERVWF